MEQKIRTSFLDRAYPENLILELYKENHWADIPQIISEDQKAGLEHVLPDLTEREAIIIKERYEAHKPIRTLAEEYDLEERRIRSILGRAKRKLRCPERAAYMIHGFHFMKQKEQQEAEKAEQRTESLIADAEKKTGISDLGNLSVSSLGLSTRVSNIMERNYITTFYELTDLFLNRYEDALGFRNCGELALQEVAAKLREYDIEIETIEES